MNNNKTAGILSEVLKWLGWLTVAVQQFIEVFTA